MNTQRIITWGLAVVLASAFPNNLLAGGKPNATKTFMRQKLTYSQNIVEGIALENYSMIITNTQKMANMKLTNTWQQVNNPTYMAAARQFEVDLLGVLDGALAKNTPAVQTAYTKVTADCVACHRVCRKEQIHNPLNGNFYADTNK